MRRFIALMIVVVLVMAFPRHVSASEVEEQNLNIAESDNHEKIEQLYELRATLSVNYEENEEIIKKIDEQLTLLGVVELSVDEVLEIMGVDALPQVSLPSENNTKWTSERSYTVTNGIEVEYQILRAVLDGEAGPLHSTASVTIEYDQPVQADLLEIGTIAVKEYAAPVVKGIVDATYGPIIEIIDGTISFFDMWSDVKETLVETTVISSVACTYTLSFVAQEQYIYVKYSGATDAGNQILCYAGNRVQYEAIYAVPGTIRLEDGSYVPHVETETITGIQKSDYYDSALAYAVTDFFYNVHLDQGPILAYRKMHSFTVTGLESIAEFVIPRSECAPVY